MGPKNPPKILSKIGPKIDSPEKAIEGFARSVSVKNISDLKIIENKKGKYYSFNEKSKKIATKDILQQNLPIILQKMSNLWPKNMRWSGNKNQPKWVRPVRNILAIFDGEIVDFSFFNIKSSDNSFGHKTISKKLIRIKNITDFYKKLSDNNVIFDQFKRKEIIHNKISEICKKHKLKTIDSLENSPLLQDVVGLVEFPNISIAKIDQKFMSLPKEVLTLTAKNHQKTNLLM